MGDKKELEKGTGANKPDDEQKNQAPDNGDKEAGTQKDGGNNSDLPKESYPSEGEDKRKEGADTVKVDGDGKADTSGQIKGDEESNKSSKPRGGGDVSPETNGIEKEKVRPSVVSFSMAFINVPMVH